MKETKKEDKGEGLCIPAGLFLGIGCGFLWGNIPAGIFVGLGLGFLAFAILKSLRK